jgi:hypothetical protein
VWGGRLCSGSFDATVRVWGDARTGRATVSLEGHTDSVWCMAVWDDALCSGGHDNTIRLWRVVQRDAEPAPAAAGSRPKSSRATSKAAAAAAAAAESSATIECAHVLRGHRAWVTALALFEDRLYSGSLDKTVRVWSRDAQCLQVLTGHACGLHALISWRGRLRAGTEWQGRSLVHSSAQRKRFVWATPVHFSV